MVIIVDRLSPASVVIDFAASVITDRIRAGFDVRSLCSTPCRIEAIRY